MAEWIATQTELAKLFGRSQTWVSRRQSLAVDPMPRDLAGAEDWGKRHGLLAGGVAPSSAELPTAASPALPAPSAMTVAEVSLKDVRRRQIELDIAIKAGDVVPRETVEAQQVSLAVEFRKTAADMSLRIRPVLERHIADAGIVASIVKDIEALVTELMNKADSHQVLRGKTVDEVRTILTARIEEVIACL
jgi:hypothetical protein